MTYPDADYSDPDFIDTELADPNVQPEPANAREALKERIEAGRQRLAERDLGTAAKQMADDAAQFTKEHPLMVVAGAIGIGLAIGAMTKPGRKAGTKAIQRTSVVALLAREAALSFGMEALDKITSAAGEAKRTGGDKLEDISDAVSTKARAVKRDTAYKAEAANDAVRTASRKAARKTGRKIRDTRERLRG